MSKFRFIFRIITMVILSTVVLVSCSKSDDTPFGLEGDAEVLLSIGLDIDENEHTIGGDTKARTTVRPTLVGNEDLDIYVINTKNDTLARWDCFNDIEEVSINGAATKVLKFTPGAYKIVAEHKPAGTKIPSFLDAYVYRAEEKFVIKAGDELPVNLVAKLGTANISVEFDPSFATHYIYSSVYVRTVGIDSLEFRNRESDEGLVGSFEPGRVRMRFFLLSKEHGFLSFSPDLSDLPKANAADHYKLTLKVKSDQGTTQVIIVSTIADMVEKSITVKVPEYFLPKDPPSFTETIGFTSGDSKDLIEGSIPMWNVKAVSKGGLSSFVIRLNDGANSALIAKLDGQKVFDLLKLEADDPMRAKLKAAGFVWDPKLDSPDEAATCTDPWIDFTAAMLAKSDVEAEEYNFTIELTDNFEQSPEPVNIQAIVSPSKVTVDKIIAGNIWANKAYFTIRANYSLVTGGHPELQYRKTGSGGWITATGGNLIVTPEANVDGSGMYSAEYKLMGLQASTSKTDMEYEFRVQANGKTIIPVDNVQITEVAAAMPSLAVWTKGAASTPLAGKEQMHVPPAGSGWATRNTLSMSQKTLSADPAKGWTKRRGDWDDTPTVNASEVSANNGTRQVSGGAIELRTTGWGQGTYSNKHIDKAGADGGWKGDGTEGSPAQGSKVRNVSAGILYLGTYNSSSSEISSSIQYEWKYYSNKWGTEDEAYHLYERYTGGEKRTEGLAFASRPNSISFEYKFTPATAATDGFLIRAELYSGGAKIAEKSWIDNAKVTLMTKKELVFDYTDKTKKATSLKIFFSSDKKIEVMGANNDGKGAVPAGSPALDVKIGTTNDGKLHKGNVLTIDNVKFTY